MRVCDRLTKFIHTNNLREHMDSFYWDENKMKIDLANPTILAIGD